MRQICDIVKRDWRGVFLFQLTSVGFVPKVTKDKKKGWRDFVSLVMIRNSRTVPDLLEFLNLVFERFDLFLLGLYLILLGFYLGGELLEFFGDIDIADKKLINDNFLGFDQAGADFGNDNFSKDTDTGHGGESLWL